MYKKKSEYFENIIIINLGDPYNYNLWRKLSNIILKNLLVILSKKKYKFLQYKNKAVLSNLKYLLIIDFLFFLKEKGNKINHFDEEVIDLILFDDLNININMDEEPKEKGKNYSQQKNKTQLKSSFNSEEIIIICLFFIYY